MASNVSSSRVLYRNKSISSLYIKIIKKKKKKQIEATEKRLQFQIESFTIH